LGALALLLAGYSIFCAVSIALTHFGGDAYREQPLARLMGLVLLLALAGLQAAHVALLYGDQDWSDSRAYRVALFIVAPSFFLFSAPLLKADRTKPWLHAVPVLLAPFLPTALARPAAFLIGAGYLVWLGRSLLALRAERSRFALEAVLLGTAFVIAVTVALLGLMPPLLPGKTFIALYASAIGLAFLLVQTALGLRPCLPAEVQEAAQARYASTTLAKVDCDAALARLETLMHTERLYADAELGLATLAGRLGLSAHQLSELLNARLGKSFARYLREQRVGAAKAMLVAEPSASVLSVGLSVGFSAQSNFYDAFREIEGTTPGQYRKLQRAPE